MSIGLPHAGPVGAMTERKVLIAGIGNIFLGDDGFGCEVIRVLAEQPLPEGVRAFDYGIGGLHLQYDLLDGWEALILVDTLPADGAPPGEVRVLEVGADDNLPPGSIDAHGMDPASVLGGLEMLGGTRPRTLVVGCPAANVGEGIGLTPAVLDAVRPAARTVRAVLRDVLAAEPRCEV